LTADFTVQNFLFSDLVEGVFTMKKFAVSLFSLFLLGILSQSASALPAVAKLWLEDAYSKSPVIEAAKEAKCNVCHYGTSKKNRNDYGMALSKIGITQDNYNKLKGDQEKLNLVLKAMFKKAESAKSVSGKTFGELIKEGKLPGTAPEGESSSP
jgi:hypothetical protein